jgi:hypothetical protein
MALIFNPLLKERVRRRPVVISCGVLELLLAARLRATRDERRRVKKRRKEEGGRRKLIDEHKSNGGTK